MEDQVSAVYAPVHTILLIPFFATEVARDLITLQRVPLQKFETRKRVFIICVLLASTVPAKNSAGRLHEGEGSDGITKVFHTSFYMTNCQFKKCASKVLINEFLRNFLSFCLI